MAPSWKDKKQANKNPPKIVISLRPAVTSVFFISSSIRKQNPNPCSILQCHFLKSGPLSLCGAGEWGGGARASRTSLHLCSPLRRGNRASLGNRKPNRAIVRRIQTGRFCRWCLMNSSTWSCWNLSPISRSLRPICASTLTPACSSGTSAILSSSSPLPSSSSSSICLSPRSSMGSNWAGKCERNPALPWKGMRGWRGKLQDNVSRPMLLLLWLCDVGTTACPAAICVARSSYLMSLKGVPQSCEMGRDMSSSSSSIRRLSGKLPPANRLSVVMGGILTTCCYLVSYGLRRSDSYPSLHYNCS